MCNYADVDSEDYEYKEVSEISVDTATTLWLHVCRNPHCREIHMNWCHIAPDSVEYRVRERAAKWFKETPEYQQQIEWVTKLREMQAEDIKNGFVTRPKQGKSKS